MTDHISQTLSALQANLDRVNRTWGVDKHEHFLQFFVRIVPPLLKAERCAVFILDSDGKGVLSKAGTGIGESEIEAPLEGSIVGRAISERRCVIENNLVKSLGFHRVADERTGFVTRSVLCVPIRRATDSRVNGAIEVLNKETDGGFDEDDANLLQEIASFLSMALDNILINGEILSLSHKLDQELARVRLAEISGEPLITRSEAMARVVAEARLVSETPVNVVIQGENGTGKELLARLIHDGSGRREQPFVAVNCAAIPENLMESEFFGYEKGAFTGATSNRRGRLLEASGGTLFLDEIADLPLSMQPKFLRVLQEGEGSPLGSNRIERYDLRIICASNKELRQAVDEGKFREDLYYRLFTVELRLPPLRERREDIAPLCQTFLSEVCERFGKQLAGFSNELLSLFEACPWPGNVRQLQHEIERLVALTPMEQVLRPENCSPELLASVSIPRQMGAEFLDGELAIPIRVEALERELIERAMVDTGGNKMQASALLGITRQGLYKKLRRYNL